MKIVHVVPTLIKGGGERVAAILANEAAKVGHEVTIVAACAVDSAQLQDSLRPDVTVRFVSAGASSRIARYATLPIWLLRQRAWLFRQDIIHCHLTYGAVVGAAVMTMRAVSRASRPVIVETYHAVGMPIPRLKRWIHARMAARRDALVLMGGDDYWRSFVRAHPALLTSTILNGVADHSHEAIDTDVRVNYRRQLGIPDDCLHVVGTVGMLRPDRKPWLYLEIFAEIAGVFGQAVHFIMAGAGPEAHRIRSLIREYRLENQVHLPGLVMDPRVPLSAMDLYLSMNIGPVAGVAAMEAALSTLPQLAIQLQPNYRRNPDDWIWSSADPVEISRKAVQLLRSPEARKKLAHQQREYVQLHHSVEGMARSYSSLYNAAITRIDERTTASK